MKNMRYGRGRRSATSGMSSGRHILSAALASAGAMYFLDPAAGRRRRALVRDRLEHALHTVRDELDVGARDAVNRARGVVADLGSRWRADDASDRVIAARVRSELGRHVTHPRAVDVTAEDGRVRLRGPILAHEAERLRSAVARVRGVTAVDDQLEVHDEPGDVPELQGRGRQADAFRVPPAARVALGSLAVALAGAVATRSAVALGTVPLVLLGAAVFMVERARLAADKQGRPAG